MWVAVLPGGGARWLDAPGWLTSRPFHDFVIVRGGRAYALVPKYGSIARRDVLELVSAGGKRCGSGAFPSETLSLGIDGTVIGSSGDGGCSLKWWPAALR